jgi:hypothetical protein
MIENRQTSSLNGQDAGTDYSNVDSQLWGIFAIRSY